MVHKSNTFCNNKNSATTLTRTYITFEKTAHARVHNIKYSCCSSKYERIVLNLLQPVVVACINTQCKLT